MFEKVLTYIVSVIIGIPMMFYRGFILSTFWGWFLVPLGVRSVSTIEAISISFVLGLIYLSSTITNVEIKEAVAPDDEDNPFGVMVGIYVKQLIIYTIFFGMGWLWHLYSA